MKIPRIIRKISKMETKTLEQRGLKLTEEAGELSAEILKLVGKKGCKRKTKDEVLDDLRLEAVDCLVMSMDLLCFTNTSDAQITLIMNSQLEKWMKQTQKH